MGVGAGLYMYVIVVQKFTFAISSPDEFLYSYLSERTQSFIYAGDATDCLPVTCSVPQGSVLGPLGFTCIHRGSYSCV